MGVAYAFETRWSLPAEPSRCWQELERMLREGAVAWWPGVRVEPAPVIARPGAACTLVVRSPLGYRLRTRVRITAVDAGRRLAADADGDLSGRGSIDVWAVEAGCILHFRWDVTTRRPWMNALAPFLHPMFRAAHDRVMVRGERGLRAVLAG
ncbi:hypothetical protein ET475_16970 [Microbacterium protaetiae]|uniref:SRPBCC family protein n=1 Tax=Microbacterium protaetiae TaxID=2509458 RepID=A0A4P6EGP8_9MICO|nr:hypothetical protein [Microbacterium protaetiae]QAY61485.1 hypothetical protein ET475_16970 [Microbacterium protaetiae]